MEDGPFINEYYYDDEGHMIRTVSNADMYPMETGFVYQKGQLVTGYSGGAEARRWEFKTEKGLVTERLGYSGTMFFEEGMMQTQALSNGNYQTKMSIPTTKKGN